MSIVVPPTLDHPHQVLAPLLIASQGHEGWGPFSVLPTGARQKTGSAVSQNLTLPEMPPPVSSCLEGNLGENEERTAGCRFSGKQLENRGIREGKTRYMTISY